MQIMTPKSIDAHYGDLALQSAHSVLSYCDKILSKSCYCLLGSCDY